MQYPVDRGRRGMLDEPVNQPGLPARLGQSIAMDRSHRAAPDPERRLMRGEAYSHVSFPEVSAPSVMVPSDHHDRQPTPAPAHGRGDVEATPGDGAVVGEPEIEQIAVDEQAVAQGWDSVEEVEKCLLDRGRRHSQMGIGYDDESVAQHGAKDGPHLPAWQPKVAGFR